MKLISLAFVIALLATTMISLPLNTLGQAEFPPYPVRSGPVTDAAGILSQVTKSSLGEKILDAQKRSGVEIVVVTVPRDYIYIMTGDAYAKELALKWKLGKQTSGRWIVILQSSSGAYYAENSENLDFLFSSDRANKVTADAYTRFGSPVLPQKKLKMEVEIVVGIIAPTIQSEENFDHAQKAPYVPGLFLLAVLFKPAWFAYDTKDENPGI